VCAFSKGHFVAKEANNKSIVWYLKLDFYYKSERYFRVRNFLHNFLASDKFSFSLKLVFRRVFHACAMSVCSKWIFDESKNRKEVWLPERRKIVT
jgi:Leu/Phe-tRNA-protein transferase